MQKALKNDKSDSVFLKYIYWKRKIEGKNKDTKNEVNIMMNKSFITIMFELCKK